MTHHAADTALDALAWVESPLQLLTAAEWAHRHRQRTGRSTAVVYRILDPQVVATAEALHRMAAPFVRFEPYLGIPWARLTTSRHWAIGDAFSGQFRAAAAVLPRPRRVTIVDDGAMVVHAMLALAGEVAYARPDQFESRSKTLLGGLVADRLRGLAHDGRVELFTSFPGADAPASRAGITVVRDEFTWLREAARREQLPAVRLPHPRIALGSARVIDALLPAERYLRWVRELAEDAPLSYLPHRRETPALLDAVGALPGVTVVRTGLPIELVLASAREPLELHTLASSAATTLRLVLAGTGSVIRETAPSALSAPRSRGVA
ncbi:hypothetical protein [Protaetiibacter larvae]|uniref:Uncharacterized protein n=1 Tax=Protaetiibacter larvae TaxID=2592654 RepID=A0A5C1Y939_9MICO|nr:hypothetical protein [Protaetiibacter larvae]QEO10484.1 hypothetical protein FLP23_10995 [Protaetiibacter larvae]